MKCREVSNRKGEDFVLTEDEERYLRALERLSKMNPGRICLMDTGRVSVRINEQWHDDNIDAIAVLTSHAKVEMVEIIFNL